MLIGRKPKHRPQSPTGKTSLPLFTADSLLDESSDSEYEEEASSASAGVASSNSHLKQSLHFLLTVIPFGVSIHWKLQQSVRGLTKQPPFRLHLISGLVHVWCDANLSELQLPLSCSFALTDGGTIQILSGESNMFACCLKE